MAERLRLAELMAPRYAELSGEVTPVGLDYVCSLDEVQPPAADADTAQRFGAACAIYAHAGVSQGRIDAIASFDEAVKTGTFPAAEESYS